MHYFDFLTKQAPAFLPRLDIVRNFKSNFYGSVSFIGSRALLNSSSVM